jgi:dynein heavy chain
LLDITVPETAKTLFEKVDTYRSQTGNLELIVDMYNEIIATLIPVEKPLMQKRISTIDKYLQPGMDELRWNSPGIDKFIRDAMEIVTEVKELVEKMKKNVQTMKELMEGWQRPLYERKLKANPPDDVENLHTAAVSSRFEEIRANGKDIAKHMKDTVDAIKPDKKSPIWIAYVDYVNGLVIEGITNGINSSMLYLAE